MTMQDAGPSDGNPEIGGEATVSPFSFQLSRPDLLALLAHLKIPHDEASPLAPLLTESPKKTDTDLKALSVDTRVGTTLSILSRPSVQMENRVGGGVQTIDFFTAALAPEIDAGAVAAMMPSIRGAFLFLLLPSLAAYLDWWLARHASGASETVPNHLPPPLDMESAVCALHAIDLFRRRAYEGLLAHETTERPAIEPPAFTESLLSAIEHRDMRWLTPAFVGLTPGLHMNGFGKGLEPLEELARRDILLLDKDDDGRVVLLFGEAGRRMGVEFYHSWFKATGFAISVRTHAGWHDVQRGFLAPTGLANHLFLLGDDDGRNVVNHQALTHQLLGRKVARMLVDAIASRVSVASTEPSVPNPRASGAVADSATSPSCPSCGQPLHPGSRFCSSCGAQIEGDDRNST